MTPHTAAINEHLATLDDTIARDDRRWEAQWQAALQAAPQTVPQPERLAYQSPFDGCRTWGELCDTVEIGNLVDHILWRMPRRGAGL